MKYDEKLVSAFLDKVAKEERTGKKRGALIGAAAAGIPLGVYSARRWDKGAKERYKSRTGKKYTPGLASKHLDKAVKATRRHTGKIFTPSKCNPLHIMGRGMSGVLGGTAAAVGGGYLGAKLLSRKKKAKKKD